MIKDIIFVTLEVIDDGVILLIIFLIAVLLSILFKLFKNEKSN